MQAREQYFRHEWLGFSFHCLPQILQVITIRFASFAATIFADRRMMDSRESGLRRLTPANKSLEHNTPCPSQFGSVLASAMASDCIVFIGLSAACGSSLR